MGTVLQFLLGYKEWDVSKWSKFYQHPKNDKEMLLSQYKYTIDIWWTFFRNYHTTLQILRMDNRKALFQLIFYLPFQGWFY